MTRLAATDFTTTILSKGVVGKRRRIYGSLVFDSSALTYTITTGIPLPSVAALGFMRQVDNIIFMQDVGAGATELVYKYDKTNHSIRVYRSAGFTPAGTIAAPTFTAVAATPAGTCSAPVFTAVEATPAGTCSAPTFTGVEYTQTDGVTTAPAGTCSAPVFTGSALTVTGTCSAPVFTGTEITISGTVSAPTFTGTAVSPTSLAEFTDNTALGASITLYFDAIGV